jgi:hypothetical protein
MADRASLRIAPASQTRLHDRFLSDKEAGDIALTPFRHAGLRNAARRAKRKLTSSRLRGCFSELVAG